MVLLIGSNINSLYFYTVIWTNEFQRIEQFIEGFRRVHVAERQVPCPRRVPQHQVQPLRVTQGQQGYLSLRMEGAGFGVESSALRL